MKNRIKINLLFIVTLILISSNIMYAKEMDRDASNSIDFKPHVVVAILDSGVNVYHKIFRRWNETMHPSTYIEGFPEDVQAVNLTFGNDWQSNYEEDKETWRSLEEKKLYWFPHTNIIAISFGQSTWYRREESGDIILDDNGHGTSTSSVIAKINPNVTILMVETGANKLKEALSWAVNQSWIDVIDIEFGVWYKPRLFFWITIWWKGLEEISKSGIENGKIIVTAAGNRPWINPWLSYVSGPPWVICVGGSEDYCHGISISAAKGADYISSFTQITAFYQSTLDYWPVSGTSLSVSTVAGTISSIIFKARKELNYIHGIRNAALIDLPEKGIKMTNWDLREIINHTAIYWNTSDWSLYDWIFKWPYRNATFPPTGKPFPWWFKLLLRKSTLTLPVNPFAPWLQMGWGFVNESIVNESVDILLGRKEMPEKPEGAIRYMKWIYEIRREIWNE
ncbi:MAG: hypothetical protein DRN12_04860 [Thermoplasmata archaeon]|nr:MAG: hypothetical protein DRN12_04860 [Thermoplasmata archaeon]